MDGVDYRYSQLLQPIRDLTKNWEIDIAAHLEEYLDELANTEISFDGGMTTMNFIQAAMLVQSSACVYSKKVEYLYALVYQVLEMLTSNKKQAHKSDADCSITNANALDNDDDEFLSLDDIQEGKHLYMENFDIREEFQLLSELPLCLIRLEEDKGENPLLSKTGEVLGSRNEYKVNTCFIDSQGTLLVDVSHLKLLQESLKILENLKTGANVVSIHIDNDEHMSDEDGAVPSENVLDNHPMDTAESEVKSDGLRRSERQKTKAAMLTASPIVDPWEYLNPHEETRQGKPASKQGMYYKRCPGLDDKVKKRKRNGLPAQKLEPLFKFLERALYSNAHKFPKNKLKVPTFPEFDALYWAELKRRKTFQHKQKQQNLENDNAEKFCEIDVDEEDNVDDDESNAELASLDDDLVDDNLFNAIENALYLDPTSVHLAQNSLTELIEQSTVVNSYEDLVRQYVEQFMSSAQEYAQTTEISKYVKEWENKILPRLEENETREHFDINKYGSCLINQLHKGSTVKFNELVQGKPTFEICRTFLASLMLANSTNVRIEEEGTLEAEMDTFAIELLSTRQHHEELQHYQAPSLKSQK